MVILNRKVKVAYTQIGLNVYETADNRAICVLLWFFHSAFVRCECLELRASLLREKVIL